MLRHGLLTDLAVTHVKLFVDGIDINRRCHASCGMWLFLKADYDMARIEN